MMRLFEFALTEASYDDPETKHYMEGHCVRLAVALNSLDPHRFLLGCVYEHTEAPNHDIPIDPDDWTELSKNEQKEILTNPEHWSMVHAFCYDKQYKVFIDARGKHTSLNQLLGNLGIRDEEHIGGRVLRYPISQHDIRQMNLGTDENGDDFDLSNNSLRHALQYAQRKLGIDISKAESQLKVRKPPVRNTSMYDDDLN